VYIRYIRGSRCISDITGMNYMRNNKVIRVMRGIRDSRVIRLRWGIRDIGSMRDN
jgi:hypothetical protein